MKIISGVFLIVFVLVQVPYAEASNPEEELLLQLTAIGEYLQNTYGVNEALSVDESRKIIIDSADWIVASQEDNGHFGYEYVPYEDVYLDDDNMVRQAGTLFALSEVYKYQTKKDPTVAEAIENSIEYFESVSAEGVSDGEEFWCIKKTARSSRCDLGTVSLALIGILNYVEAEPDKKEVYAETIQKYVTYLTEAKFPEAGFSNRYTIGDGFSDQESPFYNGEAMLALVNYYEYKADEDIKIILEKSFSYLSSKEDYETPLYLWIMAALKDMQRLWPNDEYVQYASDFTAWRLDMAALRHGMTRNYCAPVEGMVSAYSVLEDSESREYLERLYKEIEFWLGKTAWLQLNEESPYRVVKIDGQLQLVKLSNPALAHGGFLTGEESLTQRIDFTQHCVSSYLQKFIDIDGEEL